ncbi:aminotransferase-like domain-containing protein [Stappia indica]|uniref:aminotransferase-like domain-containing protein n=1 Tax=Stappia indica TaxID=538381 RepID=UPI001CD27ED7|nr:PLP-dependent aminotransferase family protein [Stappia indica]MCA1298588.1 PLP-dependent aminotransferase family protein [Stappia indica]
MNFVNRTPPQSVRVSQIASELAPNAIRNVLSVLDRPDIISFAGGIPDPTLFPRERIRHAFANALEDSGSDVLQYGASQGHPDLRQALAEHMAARGVPCGPENILVTTGSQQAIELCTRVFADRELSVLVDSPSYLGALQVFRGLGVPMVEFSDQPPGASSPGMAYVVPDFANPTGYTLSEDQRLALLGRADKEGFVVIEDAAYTELRYRSQRTKSILQLDCERTGAIEGTRTLYCGTLSKTLAPGIRIGWVCASTDLLTLLVRQKENADLLTNPISQAAAARLLGDGFDTHVDRLRDVYSQRLDALLEAIAELFPAEVECRRPDGGMFVWLTLPEHMDTEAIFAKSIQASKVAYVPGREFFSRQNQRHHLRLNFTLNPEPKARDGLKRLADLLHDEFGLSRAVPRSGPGGKA